MLQQGPDGQPFYTPDFVPGMDQAQPQQLAPQGINPVNEQPLPPPDQGPPSVTGGMLPPPVAAAAMTGFAPQPTQTTPDYQAPTQQAAPIQAEDAAASAAYAKEQAKQADVQAKQASYAATPEGQQEVAANQARAANAQEQTTAVAQGNVEAKQLDEAARIKDQAIKDEAALVAQQAKERNDRIAEEHSLFNDYQKAIEDASKKKVDPNRYWNSMSTGQHVMTGIGIMMSGLGQGLMAASGKGQIDNAAMKMVTEAIDRDVDSQKADMAQANQTVAGKRGALTDYHSLMGDMDAAAAAKKAEGRLVVADQLEASAMHFAAPQKQLEAQQKANVLRGQAAQITAGLAQQKVAQQHQAAELAVQRQNANTASWHASIASRAEKETERKNQIDEVERILLAKGESTKGADAQAAAIVDRGIMLPAPVDKANPSQPRWTHAVQQDGVTPYIAPKEEAKDIHERFRAATQGIDALDKLRMMVHDNGGNLFNTADKRAKQQEYARFIMKEHEAGGIKRLSGEAVEMFEKMASGGADVTSEFKSIMPSLDQAREDMTSDANSTLIGYTGPRITFPDPIAGANTQPLGQQLTQPFQAAPETSVDAGPQSNAPSVLNNFGLAPGAPTVAPGPSLPSEVHDYVVRGKRRP